MSQKRIVQVGNSTSASSSRQKSTDPIEHIKAGWLPINTIFLRSLLQRLAAGEFEDKVSQLVDEIRNDYGLLTYCLREAYEKSWYTTEAKDPIQLLKSLTLPQFKDMLSRSEAEVTMHSLSDCTKQQSLRIKHLLISSTTAEALSARLGISQDLVSSSAMVRQAGLSFVAWNYPRVYAKALEQVVHGDKDLERVLLSQLGFSPRALGVKLLAPSQFLSSSFMVAVGEENGLGNQEGLLALKLCEMGEKFARTSDPEHFPHEARRNDEIVKEIEHFLGPKGLSLIQEQIDLKTLNYSSASSKPLDVKIDPIENRESAELHIASRLIAGNSFITKCPDWLKDKFRKVYANLTPGKTSPEALQILVSEVIPLSGFIRGCVYLMDNSGKYLIPKLRIGDAPISRYRSISLRETTLAELAIVEALSANLPVKQEAVYLNGELVSHVSGAFGSDDKQGVLYLEISESLLQGLENESIVYFRAIRQCLNDCLNLKPAP